MTKKPTEKDVKSWRDNIGLGAYITIATSFVIFLSSLLMSGFSVDIIWKHKFRDTFAIIFLELDVQGNQLRGFLADEIGLNKRNDEGFKFSRVGRTFKPLSKVGPKSFDYNQLGIKRAGEINGSFVASLAGKPYILKWLDKKTLNVSPTMMNRYLGMSHREFKETSFYVVTKQGKLVYTNDLNIRQEELLKRQLVQKFINYPINTAQIKVTDAKKGELFGFYQEVKGTNLVLFGETKQSVLYDQILNVGKRFLLVILMVVILTMIAIQWPLRRIVNPIRELLQSAVRVSRGDFDIETKQKSFGELSVLSYAFNDMANSLAARDVAIEKMFGERQEKNRLELELEVARNIQTNLLPHKSSMGGPNVEAEGIYVPAAECAGDWFQQYFDSKKNKYYVVIADVSGHGAGSSMFTTVIATLFHESTNKDDFDIDAFFSSVHSCMQKIGRSSWHASCQVFEFDVNTRKGKVHNCGHLPPVIISPAKEPKKRMRRILAPSMVLGLKGEMTTSTKDFELDSGDCVLLMTDGLIEAGDPSGSMYGLRGLKKFIRSQADYSPKGCINDLILDVKNHMNGEAAKDDVCVLFLRVA